MNEEVLIPDVECNWILPAVLEDPTRIIVLEGGSSAAKTYSLALAFAIMSFNPDEAGATYSIVRKALPALKRSALKDFKEALALYGILDRFTLNKSDLTYTNNETGTRIEFFSLDDEQKARGPRRERLWLNEANELNYEEFSQLARRTRLQIYLDYNPSMLKHWIYDEVMTREDCKTYHATYKDNLAFLNEATVREIEVDVPVYEEADGSVTVDWTLTYKGSGRLIKGDPYRWAVYGLGQRGSPTEAIYPTVYESKPGEMPADTVLGLDFGYNHPTVLVRVGMVDKSPRGELHIDELIHQSYLTTADLIKLLPGAGVTYQDTIYADGSRPEAIAEIERAGYNIVAADKGPGSVKQGIDVCKRFKLCFTGRSEAGKNQTLGYRWKKRPDGTIEDEPVKLDDDCPDAKRYAVYSHWGYMFADPDVIIV